MPSSSPMTRGLSSRWAMRVHYHSRTPPLTTPLHFWSSPLSPRSMSPCARCAASPDPVELSPLRCGIPEGGLTIGRMFWDTAAMLDPSAVERRSKVYSRPMSRPGDLARAWQAAGFDDVVDGMITIRMDFACFEDFWNPMQGTDGPFAEYVSTLPIEGKNKLRDAVRLAYIDGEPDGARSYTATAWAVKGRVPEH